MDGGAEIENAIRRAIDNRIDFYRFADEARYVANKLELTHQERDRVFGLLAREIHKWVDQKLENL